MASTEFIFRALLRHYSKNEPFLDQLLASNIERITSLADGVIIESAHGGKTSRFMLPNSLMGQTIPIDLLTELLERVRWTLDNATADQITAYLRHYPDNRSFVSWLPI
jgi:hypothetical protein